ncbi:kinase-like protein [Nemania abortiva]|nr:kinase-like protein [Nemania abortiva]
MAPFPTIEGKQFISKGATGSVWKITDEIALKYAVSSNSDEFSNERTTYDMLEKHIPCPYIIQTFYCTENAIFLPFLACGTLEDRLAANQKRDGFKVLAVLRLEERRLVERWTAELCAAVAWLDALGIVHGDLRPTNVLVDDKSHLKLIDFDCAQKVGTHSLGGAPPWTRLRPESKPVGSFGVYGPETEQFTIGSMVYYMTRGFEPYEEPGNTGDIDIVLLWRDKIFPPVMQDDPLDHIIWKCWMGHFPTLSDLLESAKRLPGSEDMAAATTWDKDYLAAMREKCVALVESGLLQQKSADTKRVGFPMVSRTALYLVDHIRYVQIQIPRYLTVSPSQNHKCAKPNKAHVQKLVAGIK